MSNPKYLVKSYSNEEPGHGKKTWQSGGAHAGRLLPYDLRTLVVAFEHNLITHVVPVLNVNQRYFSNSIDYLTRLVGRPLFVKKGGEIIGTKKGRLRIDEYIDPTPIGLLLYAMFKDALMRYDNCMLFLESITNNKFTLVHKLYYGTPFDKDANWQEQLLTMFPGVFDGERGFDIQVTSAKRKPFPEGVYYNGEDRIHRGFWDRRYEDDHERRHHLAGDENSRQEREFQVESESNSMARESSEEQVNNICSCPKCGHSFSMETNSKL